MSRLHVVTVEAQKHHVVAPPQLWPSVPENSAVVELPAVAGVSSERLIVVTKEEIRRAGTQPWKLNNTALKSIRDSNELPVGVPIVWGIDLFESGEYEIWTDRLLAPKTPWP